MKIETGADGVRSDPWTIDRPTAAPGRALQTGAVVVGALVASAGTAWRLWPDDVRPLCLLVVAAAMLAALVGSRWERSDRTRRLLGIAGLAGTALVLAYEVGPGAALVVLSSAVLAGRALSSGIHSSLPREGAALGLGPIVAAQITYARSGSPALVVTLLVVAAGLDRWSAWRPDQVAATAKAIITALVRFAGLLGAVVLLVLVVPLLYVPGAVLALGRRLRRPPARGASTWHDAAVPHDLQQRDAIRPFVVRPGEQRSRHLAGAVVVLVVLIAAVVATRDARSSDDQVTAGGPTNPTSTTAPDPTPDRNIFAMEFEAPYSTLPAYAGTPWADDLQQQQDGPQGADLATPYVNVTDGVRRSIEAPSCDCPRLTVWFVGGSAAWGQGQRDDHTVASDLVRIAGDHGIAVDMVNIAQRGAAIGQEIDLVEERLAQDVPRPDLVVFYDGWNDVFIDLGALFTGADRPGLDALFPMDAATAINAEPDTFLDAGFGPEAGHRAAARIRTAREEIDPLLADKGIDVAQYFQPDAFSSTKQMEGYDKLTGVSAEEFAASPFATALDTAVADLDDEVISLRDLFDDEDQPVFLGLIHQNEAGARAVAERMYDTLGPRFEQLAH